LDQSRQAPAVNAVANSNDEQSELTTDNEILYMTTTHANSLHIV